MSKIYDLMDKYLMGPMGKMSTLQFVRAVMAAGVATIPFTIVGSAFLILNILPQAFPFLQGAWDAVFNRLTNLYMIGNYFTMGILALYFNIVMGYELTKIKAQDFNLPLTPINGALLSMMAFLFTMTELSINSEGTIVYVEGDGYINGVSYGNFAQRLSSSGIFTAIIMAVLAVWIYKECIKRGWAIKLPDAVPAGVSRSFTALIPCACVAIVVIVLNGLLLLIGYDIYTIIAVPFGFIASIANTWYGIFISGLVIQLLWSVGIHGANIIGSMMMPIGLANLQNNIDIYTGAKTGHYEVAAGSWNMFFAACGGSGGTLGMCIWMCFFAKSDQLKVLGRAAIGPSVFNINEPLIFGMPLMYNPNLLIPFIFAVPICSMLVYFLISSGIFPPVIADAPWPTPGPIAGFIVTGSIMGAVLSILAIAFDLLLYYPFLIAYDRKLAREEKEMEAQEAAAAA